MEGSHPDETLGHFPEQTCVSNVLKRATSEFVSLATLKVRRDISPVMSYAALTEGGGRNAEKWIFLQIRERKRENGLESSSWGGSSSRTFPFFLLLHGTSTVHSA